MGEEFEWCRNVYHEMAATDQDAECCGDNGDNGDNDDCCSDRGMIVNDAGQECADTNG
jgi:hypothetical protein